MGKQIVSFIKQKRFVAHSVSLLSMFVGASIGVTNYKNATKRLDRYKKRRSSRYASSIRILYGSSRNDKLNLAQTSDVLAKQLRVCLPHSGASDHHRKSK